MVPPVGGSHPAPGRVGLIVGDTIETTCLLPTGHENAVGCMYSKPSTVKRAPAGSVIIWTDTNCSAASGIVLKPANIRKTEGAQTSRHVHVWNLWFK